jgi:hypothetical protein
MSEPAEGARETIDVISILYIFPMGACGEELSYVYLSSPLLGKTVISNYHL